MVLYKGNALAIIAGLLKYDSIHTVDHGEERIGEAHDAKNWQRGTVKFCLKSLASASI